MSIYLQQFIAQTTHLSRRQATQLIKSAKVKLNGKIGELGQKVNPLKDKIEINNKLIKPQEDKIYYLVNKPLGYTSTFKDKHAKHKVTDLVPKQPKVWPVGRLDKDSTGLIILTNDGELTHKLTHPSFKHPKEYLVTLNKPIQPSLLSTLTKGVKLKEGIAKADKVRKINNQKLSLILHQGWNRQIRRMLSNCRYQVINLERIRIDNLKLSNLKPGQYIKVPKL